MDNLKTKTVKGIAWSMVDQVFNLVTTLLITVFLARLIEPSEFGLLAMVTVMVGFLQIFRDFGLGAALIQKKELSQREINSVFWLNTTIGGLIGGLLYLSAPYIAEFYHEGRLIRLTQAMAGVFAIGSLGIVPDALIRKKIDFKEIFLRNALVVILSGLIAIYLAYRGYGVWALVAQRVVLTTANAGISFMIIKWWPTRHFHPGSLKEFIRSACPSSEKRV
jgi:O-antigen/teichoic acid export membrane protein